MTCIAKFHVSMTHENIQKEIKKFNQFKGDPDSLKYKIKNEGGEDILYIKKITNFKKIKNAFESKKSLISSFQKIKVLTEKIDAKIDDKNKSVNSKLYEKTGIVESAKDNINRVLLKTIDYRKNKYSLVQNIKFFSKNIVEGFTEKPYEAVDSSKISYD